MVVEKCMISKLQDRSIKTLETCPHTKLHNRTKAHVKCPIDPIDIYAVTRTTNTHKHHIHTPIYQYTNIYKFVLQIAIDALDSRIIYYMRFHRRVVWTTHTQPFPLVQPFKVTRTSRC